MTHHVHGTASEEAATMTPVDLENLNDLQLDALREIGNIGAGTAASSLSQMTGQPIAMAVPRVSILPVEEIPARIGGEEQIVVAVYLQVMGDAPGHIVFLSPAETAHEVCHQLMGGMPSGDEVRFGFSEMELSALQEIGNIMTGSYLRALAELTGMHLEPSPPALGVDMAAALLGSVLAEVARNSGAALLIETAFEEHDLPSFGHFVYIPEPASLLVVLRSLGLAS
ncbi:MAG: chemotaxis protein CheC [Thermoleophilia bacterium]